MSSRSGMSAGRSDWTKPLRNAGRLAAGRGVQAVCSIAYLAIAARVLGPENFGALVLIHSLALAIAQFSTFGSMEMLVRFGSLALADGRDHQRLHRLIRYGHLLDGLGILIAWTGMILAAQWALNRFEMPPGMHRLTLVYWFAAVLIMNLSQTYNGALRLLDRFKLLAYQSTVEPVLRLLGAVLMMRLEAGLFGFLAAWFVALLAGRVTLILTARWALRRENLPAAGPTTFREIANPERGIWRFVLWLQWTTTAGLATTQLPLLAIGGMLNNSAAGLYKLAQQITALLERANSKLLVPSLYTELSRLSASREHAQRRHMVLKITGWLAVVGAGLFVLLVLLGKPLLLLVAGEEFIGAYPVMLWLAAAGVIGSLSVTLEPLLMAAGRMRTIALAGTLPLLVFVPLLFALIERVGLVGVGMAATVYAVLYTSLLVLAVRRMFAREATAQPA
ncbi:MAG: lipopolysaccharide biosynthesis protein [Opitutaceae bacterium]|nr:lipopolysaccharide biosynthesis protein [Opitutaceae bacterium]